MTKTTKTTKTVAVKVEHLEEILAHLVAINEMARPVLSAEILGHLDAASGMLHLARSYAPEVEHGG
jgi:hypothetical protein